MGFRSRVPSFAGGARVISVLGGLFVAAAVAEALTDVLAGAPVEAGIDFLLIGVPGIVLLYGGYWLLRSSLRPDVHARVAAWCLGGTGVMLAVVGLLILNPAGNVNRPLRAATLAAALGAVAGLGVGVNNARAVSRALDAEQHNDELLRERNMRERIVQTSPIGISIMDPDGTVKIVNERAAEITGISREELLELDTYNHPMFEVADDDGNPVEEGVFPDVLATGEPVYDIERQFTRADGRQLWLSVSVAPLHDPSGDLTAVVSAFKDITERKEYERKLEESNERLEQFAYAASHDLQEPLRMVSSYLQLLERRHGDELDEEAMEYLAFAVDSADRMRAMVESLLEYSRVTTRGNSSESTDAGAVLEDVLDDLQLRIEETDATVTADDLPTVTADPDQLAQVFRNLLSNALAYSGDEPPQVHVGVERTNGEWRFSVADEGVGIDPEYHERIFEVFESGHAGGERTGSGIGLALCERIVEHHDGGIWVESEPGEGATFYFTISTSQERQSASAVRDTARDERERSHGE